MHHAIIRSLASSLAAFCHARPDPAAPPLLTCGKNARNGANAMRAASLAMALLATAPAAFAQVPRNGPEWGGMDHQPTQAQVLGREKRAGIAPTPAQAGKDNRTVGQLDHQLLRAERVNPPRQPHNPVPPPASRPPAP